MMSRKLKVQTRDAREIAVLRNAKRLIAKFGASNVTFDDLARGHMPAETILPEQVGSVPKAYVRGMFRHKHECLERIFDDTWGGILSALNSIVKRETTARARLHCILSEIPVLLAQDLDATAVVIRERYGPVVGEGAHSGYPAAEKALRIMGRVFGEIQKENRLRSSLKKPRPVIHAFYGAIEHGMLDMYIQSQREVTDSPIERAVRTRDRVEALVNTLLAMADGVVLPPEGVVQDGPPTDPKEQDPAI